MLNGQLDVYASHDIRRPEAKEKSGACVSNSKQFIIFWDAGQIASPLLVPILYSKLWLHLI